MFSVLWCEVLGKLTVEYSVYERGVQAAEQHDGLEEEHAYGPRQDHDYHLVDVWRVELDGCQDGLALLAHGLGFLLEHDGPVCLGHEQQRRPSHSGEDQHEPVRPPP
jgi:hypothetical protein